MWCFITRQPPEVYQRLTRLEREQFAKAAIDAAKKGWV
ncbi:hypothetical protein FHU40_000958 [Nocardioides soli]|uniref:Uncharacterized protein n=1 Tax=Nocardioides soli TaxID=1036020 RepID=A0A7W4VTN5_9ACTN|nr:hypothetical protein [Nocardioides soli]